MRRATLILAAMAASDLELMPNVQRLLADRPEAAALRYL